MYGAFFAVLPMTADACQFFYAGAPEETAAIAIFGAPFPDTASVLSALISNGVLNFL